MFQGQIPAGRVRRTFGAASLIALAAAAPAIFAGTAAAQSSDEVVVTGTRITGFTAPTPVTQLTAEQLEEKSISAVSELLDDIPQLRMNQNIGKSSEPVGGSNADLRSLGSQRTLVLFDGRRVGVTDPAGTIDTNIIPVSIIKGVDVVTGGASAAYGSDAVGGVVNFVLDKKFTGFKADVAYGQTKYNDHERPTANFAWGGDVGEKLHVLVAGDYMHNSGQTRQAARPWGNRQTVLLTNPAFTTTNGQYARIIADYGRFVNQTAGGMFATRTRTTATPATQATGQEIAVRLGYASNQSVQFGPDGQPRPFNFGTSVGATYMAGGDGATVEDEGNILPDIGRWSGFLRGDYEITPKLKVYADYLYSTVKVKSDLGPNPDAGGITIRNDNPYLAQSVKTAMAAGGYTTFNFGRINFEDGNSNNNNKTDVQRWSLGLEGELGDNWRWDLSATIGRNDYVSKAANNRITQRWTYGLDAVVNGSGQIVCRVTRDTVNPNDTTDPFRDIRDCKPINPFGAGSINATALSYYRGTSVLDASEEQDVYAFNISGEPFSTPGGPISVAAGGEHRRESTVQRADSDSALRRWRSINAQPFSGEYDVDEGYVEFAAPLAAGQPLADHFDVNGAFRYTDYSTSGAVRTWKIGLNYAPVSVLRFRGVVSQDIRAPNNFELYSNGNQVLSPLVDRRDNQSRTVLQLTRGNALLKPEKASTHSIGVVYQGESGPLAGLRASIDYYEINISQAITNPPPQDIIDFCFKGQTQFCSGVIISPTTNLITQVNVSPFNADSQKTSGLDLEASYRFEDVMGGDFTVRLLSNFVRELTTISNGVANDYVGLAGLPPPPTGVPEWRTNVDFNYHRDALRLGLGYRFMGGGKFDTRYNITQRDLQNNDINGRSYVDINASYDLTKNYTVYGRVENLFDVDPPITPNAINQPTIANSQFYDKRGLFWVVGGRVKF